MKTFIGSILLIYLYAATSAACPNLNGKFGRKDGAYYQYSQTGCDKIAAQFCYDKSNCSQKWDIIPDGKATNCTNLDCRSYEFVANALVMKNTASWSIPHGVATCEFNETYFEINAGNDLVISHIGKCSDGFNGKFQSEIQKRF